MYDVSESRRSVRGGNGGRFELVYEQLPEHAQ